MKLLEYKYLALDFDGIFTDNKVYCDSNGNEFVRCCKYDSMALSIFKKFTYMKNIDLKMFIISSEKNEVVSKRANKLGLEVYQGVEDKFKFLDKSLLKNKLISNFNELIYLGNDINDLKSIKASGFSACPKDSPEIIKKYSDFVGEKSGGNGFIREVLAYLISPLNLHDVY